MASWTSLLLNFRPIKRFTEKMVFSGLVMACRLAICPTKRSFLSVMPTTEGVVRLPSALAMTTGSPPLIIATQEFVVPRSIPITLPMGWLLRKKYQYMNDCVSVSREMPKTSAWLP